MQIKDYKDYKYYNFKAKNSAIYVYLAIIRHDFHLVRVIFKFKDFYCDCIERSI